MRVQFQRALREAWVLQGGIRKPKDAPPGYTPHTVVTEWLTLNCTEAWAGQGRSGCIEVRFVSAEDAARAQAHFTALSLWR